MHQEGIRPGKIEVLPVQKEVWDARAVLRHSELLSEGHVLQVALRRAHLLELLRIKAVSVDGGRTRQRLEDEGNAVVFGVAHDHGIPGVMIRGSTLSDCTWTREGDAIELLA